MTVAILSLLGDNLSAATYVKTLKPYRITQCILLLKKFDEFNRHEEHLFSVGKLMRVEEKKSDGVSQNEFI